MALQIFSQTIVLNQWVYRSISLDWGRARANSINNDSSHNSTANMPYCSFNIRLGRFHKKIINMPCCHLLVFLCHKLLLVVSLSTLSLLCFLAICTCNSKLGPSFFVLSNCSFRHKLASCINWDSTVPFCEPSFHLSSHSSASCMHIIYLGYSEILINKILQSWYCFHM